MSVVRLEMTVRDTDAQDVAEKLFAGFGAVVGDVPRGNVTVDIHTEAEAEMDRGLGRVARFLIAATAPDAG